MNEPIQSQPCPLCQTTDDRLKLQICDAASRKRLFCRRCGLIYLDQIPAEKPLYDLEYTLNFYRASDMRKYGVITHTIDMILGSAGEKKRVLDVGTATGFIPLMLSASGYDAYGLEPDEETCVYIENHLGTKMFCADILTFSHEGNFDLIYAGQVIEHLPDPIAFFKKCDELLSPGGKLLLDTPDGSYGLREGESWHHFQTRHPYEHLNIFTKQALHFSAFRTSFILDEVKSVSPFMALQALYTKPNIHATTT